MKITIIGCGHMGSAIAQRLSTSHELYLVDRNPDKIRALEKKGYGTASKNVIESIDNSELLILAIKPQNLDQIDTIINGKIKDDIIVISLLAGTPISTLIKYFPHQEIIRMMPNLAISYGEGLVALASNDDLTEFEKKKISDLCEYFGKVYWMSESKINGFTALASSGLGYSFAIIEAMIHAGMKLGFSSFESEEIILQMMRGSLTVLEETKKHPSELKLQVASPGGTTIAGLMKFEEQDVSGGIIKTFLAANKRAEELSTNSLNDNP